jgi:ABC-type transport system substrate-binding protein
MTYPTQALDCKNPPAGYTGEFSQIKALDAQTVEFDLCFPDVAFLSKVAFSSNAISQKDYLTQHVADGTVLTQPNGTGPYTVKEWVKGDHITYVANPNYWGEQPAVPTAILRWGTEPTQRLTELQSGGVDGIDNPAPDDIQAIKSDPNLTLYPRQALNQLFVGMNNLYDPWGNEKVRQAIGLAIDRQRIVDNFYGTGSTVADYFNACAIQFACVGTKWPAFDPVKAKQLLADAGFPRGFKTTLSYRDVSRPYLPNPNQVAQDIQAQLKQNLNLDVTLDVQESATFSANVAAGTIKGLYLAGVIADYPDMVNLADFEFGGGASNKKFGKPYPDIQADLVKGGQIADPAAREAIYADFNDLLVQHVPMVPIVHAGSATVFKSDVQGAHSSPIVAEQLYVMKPANRDQVVFMQNAEPLSLFCADESDGESLRACEQVTQGLYGFKTAGTDPEPALATQCKPNAELTVWTCTLRENVKFDDGSILDANDVVVTFAAQWDAQNPLHKGHTSVFELWGTMFGGFLNAPPS